MNAQDFTSALASVFLDEQLSSALRSLEPTAPAETPTSKQVAAWYGGLPQSDKDQVRELLRGILSSCIFHFLVLLDNCDTITAEEEVGYFELFYATPTNRVRLNIISDGPADLDSYRLANEAIAREEHFDMLHDLYMDAVSKKRSQ